MRLLAVVGLILWGCIDDPAPTADSSDPTDVGVLDARVLGDGSPPSDSTVRDLGRRDAEPRDAARDSAPVIDRGPPSNCDQPDPGSCEAAGCRWSDLAGCEVSRSCRLGQAACERSSACNWGPNPLTDVIGCWPVVGSPCSGWHLADCQALATCLIIQNTCIDAIDAPCDQVAALNCWRTPHCVEEFSPDCAEQPKQQEPPQEADAGIGFVPDAALQPEPEPEAPIEECFGVEDCDAGEWCDPNALCRSCQTPARCVDAP